MTALFMPVAEPDRQLDSGELQCPWQVFEWHAQLTEFQCDLCWHSFMLFHMFLGINMMLHCEHTGHSIELGTYIRKNTNVPHAALRGDAWGRVRELHARRGAWRPVRSVE
jgi:hypothetical protein